MKYIFLVLISAVAIPCLSFADEIETEKVIEILRSETIKSLTIEASQIEDPSLEACFAARFFATKVGVVVSGGRMSSGGYYALKDDRLIMLSMPNTNGPVPIKEGERVMKAMKARLIALYVMVIGTATTAPVG